MRAYHDFGVIELVTSTASAWLADSSSSPSTIYIAGSSLAVGPAAKTPKS